MSIAAHRARRAGWTRVLLAAAAAVLAAGCSGGSEGSEGLVASDDVTPVVPYTDPADGDAGTFDNPVGFGQPYDWEQWRFEIVEVVDAAADDLLDRRVETPPDGSIFVAVVKEVTYLGDDSIGLNPISIHAVDPDTGTTRYGGTDCLLRDDELEAAGLVPIAYEIPQNAPVRYAQCFQVPATQVDRFKVEAGNGALPSSADIYFAENGAPIP